MINIIRLRLKTIIFFLLLFSIYQSDLFSQEKGQKEESTESTEKVITAVPVIEIPQKIEEAYVFIKEIESQQIPSKPIEELKEDFTEILRKDSLLKVESTKEFIQNLPSRKLEDYNAKWDAYLNSILSYKKILEDDAAKITEIKESYQNFDARWDLTYDNAKKEKAPRAIITRLNELNRDTKKLDKRLVKILNQILLLRDKVSTEEFVTNEVITLIAETIKAHKSMLFSIDSPPIWIAISEYSDTTTFANRWEKNKGNIRTSFIDFYKLYGSRIVYYAIFFVIVFTFILYLKRFAKNNTENPIDSTEDVTTFKILSKPFSIAILIALFAEELFFPSVPGIVSQIFSILFIFPLLSLFPTYISKEARGPLYFITSIYLLQQVLDLGSTNTLNQRIFIIVLIMLSIIAFIYIIKIPISSLPTNRKNFISFITTLSKILIVVLSLSLIANFIGSTKLSRLVLSGVMTSIYSGLLLITGYQVFNVLLSIFLETKFANLFLVVQNRKFVIKKTLLKLLKIAAFIVATILILEGFGLYQFFLEIITDFLETSWKVGESTIAVADIFLFFISIWVSIKLSTFIRFILDGELLPRINLPRGVPGAISLMANYVILTLGLLFAFVAIGFDLSKFAIVFGALGVGIGFGLQNIVNNFISGLILLFERPIQVGDVISIQNLSGTVKRIGIRSSIIAGWDGSEEIVPNADLVSTRVTNWTLSNKNRRIEIKIGVEYGSDPEQVMELLRYSISSRGDVLKEPSAYVLFEGFSDRTMDFTFRFWIPNTGDWIFIKSEVFVHISSLLQEASIKVPYPQMDVKIKESEDSSSGKEEEELKRISDS